MLKPTVGFTLYLWLLLTLFINLIFFLLWYIGGFSVFAGVGERTREGNDLYREMIESGVIKLGEKQVNAKHTFILPLLM